MATLFEASTPPPPSRVHTPSTPKHGYTDNWEPFSPRKSARISEKAIKNRTPSPRSTTTSRNPSSRATSTVFGTPAASPQKKRAPAMDSVRRAAAHLTGESAADAAGLLGVPTSKSHPTSATRGSGMLPTPAKTPSDSKKRNVEIAAGVRAAARTLFHDEVDTITSSRKKRTKKYTGVGLESFNAEEIDEPIEIFTDSRDRLPQVDRSLDNPFYGETSAAAPEPPKRRSPRRKMVMIPGEGRVPMEDAVQRRDGTVYVFRGKAFWKPNGDSSPVDEDGEASDDLLNGAEVDGPSRRLTRSSVQPRLLFPSKAKGKEVVEHNTEDEEAATDIEDHVVIENKDDKDAVETPAEKPMPGTPTAPRFAPASPPSTTRTTRLSKRLEDSVTPMKRPTKTQSPFDTWRRSKSHAGTHGQKREADTPATGVAKRQRA
ncbi:hypothetical protein PG993_004941 [Apiospora rasikravindrae]|uniref:Uncharacterized protein n=1 Tax=Apiospora rasikravindrae TaxID=990691 RepID=A0ABR1TEU3_9PEZI